MTLAAILCLCLVLLAPLAAAGMALINTGLGRSRSAAHSMLAALCVMSVAAIVYCMIGFSWQGYAGGAAHSLSVGGKPWSWIAAEPFFLRGRALDGSPVSLVVLFGMISVGIAALIPLGAARTAGAWERVARPRPYWPDGPIRSSRTGSGAADGSRSWAQITGSAMAFWMPAERVPFTLWAG